MILNGTAGEGSEMGGPSTPPGKQCSACRHYLGLRDVDPHPDMDMEGLWLPACQAFPGGIPFALLCGQRDHRLPFPGDHGIRYEEVHPLDLDPPNPGEVRSEK